ncbi:MAG: hypothetical protein JW889_02825 [Verrucomicrobia bacterium]|nr:hypothetical protein [Verrucomicrobiota bacterium]
MALTLFRWIHVMAAALWLGSLVFIIVVMRAPVQELGRHTTLDPMLVRFRARFKGMLIATAVALVVSGIGALAVQHVPPKAFYVVLIIAKILLSSGVIALFWYVAFVRQEPRKRLPEAVDSPQTTPAAGEGVPSGEAIEDADFFFRPKPHQASVQWWIVGATAAAVLLGLVAAHKGTGLAEQRKEQQRKARATEQPQEQKPNPNE